MISNIFNILGKLLELFRSLYYRGRDGEINIQKIEKHWIIIFPYLGILGYEYRATCFHMSISF